MPFLWSSSGGQQSSRISPCSKRTAAGDNYLLCMLGRASKTTFQSRELLWIHIPHPSQHSGGLESWMLCRTATTAENPCLKFAALLGPVSGSAEDHGRVTNLLSVSASSRMQETFPTAGDQACQRVRDMHPRHSSSRLTY